MCLPSTNSWEKRLIKLAVKTQSAEYDPIKISFSTHPLFSFTTLIRRTWINCENSEIFSKVVPRITCPTDLYKKHGMK